MNPPSLDFRNVNALWGSVVAETLVRSGVATAVISPGSRSTPLAFALARHPGIDAIPVLDERSASFFALGLAKRDLRPVVLLCTSGTAGANYFPAVIEAHEAGVPLVVLTADRPPEMRACASGQTIDQQRLYGSFVSFHHELAVPEASLPLLRYLRQTVAHAVERSLAPFRGPVHLNAPFRDPCPGGGRRGDRGLCGPRGLGAVLRAPEPAYPVLAVSEIPPFSHRVHGIIVAGPVLTADPAAHAAAVAEIARKLGWPVLADGLSPARNHGGIPHLVTRYDTILRSPKAAESLQAGVRPVPRGVADQQGPARVDRGERGAHLLRHGPARQPRRPPRGDPPDRVAAAGPGARPAGGGCPERL
jgi:2-succinyl-5-enolpyruvyl-6-hydroxy-3-cyclohexene-1-carboxylate synthase